MPRKSAAALQLAQYDVALPEVRLPPPPTLSPAEKSVWLQCINDLPASSFTPVHVPMLELYCRHVVRSRILADEITTFDRSWLADDEGLKRYDRLLAMAEREGRAASSLATRLRITRQAVEEPDTVGIAKSRHHKMSPWQAAAKEKQGLPS